MQKTKLRLRLTRKPAPVLAHRLKQLKRSDNVRLDKVVRAKNRAVHMRLRREVDDSARLVLR